MIIDIHTHTFPDKLAGRAIAELTSRAKIPAYTDGTCTDLCRSMQQAGIARSAIMPIATKPSQVEIINRWAVEVNEKYDSLYCFGTLHPDSGTSVEQIAWLREHDIRCIKMHPDYQSFFVDDPRLHPMYQALADAGMVIMFHAGIDIGLPPPTHCPPDRLANVLATFPQLTIIAAHMGGWMQWDDVDRYLIGKDLYFDTSMCLPFMNEERLTGMIKRHGAERILFGTDSPWTDQAAEVCTIQGLALTEDEKTAILGENARRLLKIA